MEEVVLKNRIVEPKKGVVIHHEEGVTRVWMDGEELGNCSFLSLEHRAGQDPRILCTHVTTKGVRYMKVGPKLELVNMLDRIRALKKEGGATNV